MKIDETRSAIDLLFDEFRLDNHTFSNRIELWRMSFARLIDHRSTIKIAFMTISGIRKFNITQYICNYFNLTTDNYQFDENSPYIPMLECSKITANQSLATFYVPYQLSYLESHRDINNIVLSIETQTKQENKLMLTTHHCLYLHTCFGISTLTIKDIPANQYIVLSDDSSESLEKFLHLKKLLKGK